MFSVVLLIVAIVLFVVAALPTPQSFRLLAAGAAFTAGALLAAHFGV